MAEERKTRTDRWGGVCSVETEEERKKSLHKFLKFDIEESKKMKDRPWDFWETEEGLEIAIVRARENLLFFLEDINIGVKILSEGIVKSVEETDTLKNVDLRARALTEQIKEWLESTLDVATALEKNFQMLEKTKTDYFPKKLSPESSCFAGLGIILAGDNERKELLKEKK